MRYAALIGKVQGHRRDQSAPHGAEPRPFSYAALEERTPGTFDPSIGPERWMEFLDKTGLEYSVLFPTEGLAYGQVSFVQWAVAYARGYNDWLYEKYLKFSPKLKGVALIPMQDVPSAVAELRRAVKELGMLGAMLPSNGLRLHLGAKDFWPIYEEAETLGCALAVHGGCYGDLGFNSYGVFPATRALGMPFPLAIAATGMIVEGIRSVSETAHWFPRGGTPGLPSSSIGLDGNENMAVCSSNINLKIILQRPHLRRLRRK